VKHLTPARDEPDRSILAEFDIPAYLTQSNLSQLQISKLIQQKCSEVGFDWPDEAPVIEKIKEELEEVKEALANPTKGYADIEEELGDLLFACVNLCRHLDVSPELAITLANQKFVKRFQFIETNVLSKGERLEEQSFDSLAALWVEAKANK
jgi:uncharacterized protein YabN with tetrapyrrole methylase and pyrophosphatase domain